MTLPAPNLDDRRFQDLVDDAKRYVQQNCPQWTDHNVSDPGVTLIETFAMVTDQLLYRLNRVPDRLYLRFLELLGLQFVRPTSATTEVTFWLSAPQPDTIRVPVGTEVATRRTPSDEAVRFETTEELAIVPCSRLAVAVQPVGAPDAADQTDEFTIGRPVAAFSAVPAEGDAVLFGLSAAVPRCAVTLRLRCQVTGVGIVPTDPPWAWEAWNGGYWEPCELEPGGDTTGGFNEPGDVLLHVPASHRLGMFGGIRAGWLRCVFRRRDDKQAGYDEPPLIHDVSAFTIGGTTAVSHQETVHDEVLGISTGVPGQRFPLSRGPVLTGPVQVEVAGEHGWRPWTQVDDFDLSADDDEHVALDAVAREVTFGPARRELDGTVRRLGAVPPPGAPIRATYRVSGGSDGNVLRGAIRTLRSQVPTVTRVENRRPASGGVDGEDITRARQRAPEFLRTRERAVTRGDFEYLARMADPRVARARAVPDEDAPAVIRVLLVPGWTGDAEAQPALDEFRPPNELLARVSAELDERRVLGTRLVVAPAHYEWVSAQVFLRIPPGGDERHEAAEAVAALHRFLHPLCGGPEGRGWPFGHSVTAGELLSAVQHRLGVHVPEAVRLYKVDRSTGARLDAWSNRIDLGAGALPFSVGHTVERV
jgi:predicted phage baseplate assembly protein